MSCTIRTLTNINISLILGHTKHENLLQFIDESLQLKIDIHKKNFRASNTEDFHIISNAILGQWNDRCSVVDLILYYIVLMYRNQMFICKNFKNEQE